VGRGSSHAADRLAGGPASIPLMPLLFNPNNHASRLLDLTLTLFGPAIPPPFASMGLKIGNESKGVTTKILHRANQTAINIPPCPKGDPVSAYVSRGADSVRSFSSRRYSIPLSFPHLSRFPPTSHRILTHCRQFGRLDGLQLVRLGLLHSGDDREQFV
jgi:hypothetical protein